MANRISANLEAQEVVDVLAAELHEFRGINFNAGDLEPLVAKLRSAAAELSVAARHLAVAAAEDKVVDPNTVAWITREGGQV